MIKLRLLLEQKAYKYTAAQFRTKWAAMGNTIKNYESNPTWWKAKEKYADKYGDEMTNGGAVNESLLGIMIELAKLFGKGLEVTGGNDVYHELYRPGSSHQLGNALDIVPASGWRDTQFEKILESAVKLYPGFSYINEFVKSTGGTGGHYHLEYNGPSFASKPAAKSAAPKTPSTIYNNDYQAPADATRVNVYKKPMPNLKKYKP